MLERIGQPTERFGDAVGSDQLRWPSAVPPPWLPMAGNDERPAPKLLEILDDRPQDGEDIGDPPAAGGDGHALAGPHGLLQVQSQQLGVEVPATSSSRGPSKV